MENVERLAHRETFDVAIVGSDTGSEMQEEILRFAFPEVATLYYGDDDGHIEDVIDVDALKAAVKRDALPLVRAAWRRAQLDRSTDPLAQIAREMDAPVELVWQWLDGSDKE